MAELTRNQALVVEALRHAEGPMSAYSILDTLRGEGFRAPLQVYRALDKLMEMGLVHRLESLNAFVACSHPHHAHEAHAITGFAICDQCGQVDEFHDQAIDERLGAWTARSGFHPGKTTIEIRGRCRSCG